MIKEELYIQAIKNLLKKYNFQLYYQQLITKQISKSQFEKKIKQCSIKIREKPCSNKEIKHIMEIVRKIDEQDKEKFSTDEVAELFSVPYNSFDKYMDKCSI